LRLFAAAAARGRSGERLEKRGRQNTGALFGVASASIIHHCRTWRCLGLVTGEFSFSSPFFMLLLFVERKSRIAREKKKTLPSLPTDFPPLAVPFFFPKKTFLRSRSSKNNN